MLEGVQHKAVFDVWGKPITQGSKTARIVGKRVTVRMPGEGKPVSCVAAPRAVLIERGNMATKTRKAGELDAWRELVAAAAARAMQFEMTRECCSLSGVFVFQRPKSHYTSKGFVTSDGRRRQPPGDLSKLVRAVEDAMSGVVYVDDRQIVIYDRIAKRWAGSDEDSHAHISVTVL